MSKFKVGDLVAPTKFFGCAKIWEHYEVIHVYGNTFKVISDDGHGECFSDEYWTHYGQTLAELNVKAGDVMEYMDTETRFTITLVDGDLEAVCHLGVSIQAVKDSVIRRWRIISRASDTPNWLPCPVDYKPQGNHEVTYHMGVPTHYYVTEPVLVDVEQRIYFHGIWTLPICGSHGNATLRGKTQDGKPVGQWTIDMDAD